MQSMSCNAGCSDVALAQEVCRFGCIIVLTGIQLRSNDHPSSCKNCASRSKRKPCNKERLTALGALRILPKPPERLHPIVALPLHHLYMRTWRTAHRPVPALLVANGNKQEEPLQTFDVTCCIHVRRCLVYMYVMWKRCEQASSTRCAHSCVEAGRDCFARPCATL